MIYLYTSYAIYSIEYNDNLITIVTTVMEMSINLQKKMIIKRQMTLTAMFLIIHDFTLGGEGVPILRPIQVCYMVFFGVNLNMASLETITPVVAQRHGMCGQADNYKRSVQSNP